jgi:hypothetical protein
MRHSFSIYPMDRLKMNICNSCILIRIPNFLSFTLIQNFTCTSPWLSGVIYKIKLKIWLPTKRSAKSLLKVHKSWKDCPVSAHVQRCSGHERIPVCPCCLLPAQMCHMCGNGAEGDAWGRSGRQKGLVGEGQVIHTMGRGGGKFISLHKGLPPQVCFFFNCHTCANHPLYSYIMLICSCAIIFFSSAG